MRSTINEDLAGALDCFYGNSTRPRLAAQMVQVQLEDARD
jgi:hypothetical protein